MEYVYLGNTNIKVSKVCLGCMSFGDNQSGFHEWTLNYEESEKIIKKALELGINYFDTANVYSYGSSEKFLGKALKKYAKREDVVIQTKVYFNPGHLSKEAIFREVDLSLERLDTNYIDILVIHRFDYHTPISETMEALDALVKSGKVRAIGASAMYAYQYQAMQDYAKYHNLTTFSVSQNHYNLIYREDERELLKVLKNENITSTPYSPLAAGHLSRPTWRDDSSLRDTTDKTSKKKYDASKFSDINIVKRVSDLAKIYNVTMTEVSLQWLISKGCVPIVGITKLKYLYDMVNSIDLKLTDEDIYYLEEEYQPHNVVGAIDKNPEDE